MAWDSLFTGGTKAPAAKGWGGLFDDTVSQEQILRKQRQRQLEQEAQISAREAQEQNSFKTVAGIPIPTSKGAAKTVVVDLGHKLAQVPVDFVKETYSIYEQTPGRMAGRFKNAVNETQEAVKNPSFSSINKAKNSVGKAAALNAGAVVQAVFAPVSGAIGAVLKATGGDKLVDSAGNVVADKSGITDLPAFQKYAMTHPSAGEDFTDLLNLVMIGGAKNKINPEQVRMQSAAIAQKMIEPQFKASEVSGTLPERLAATGERSVQPYGDTTLRRLPVEGRSAEISIPNSNRYTAPQDLPAIEMGRGRTDVPTVRYSEPGAPNTGSYKYEPIPQDKSPWESLFSKETTTQTSPKSQTTTSRTSSQREVPVRPTSEPVSVKTVENLPEGQAVNTRAQKLLTSAVEKKLVDDFSELPTHNRMNMTEQANKAVEFIARDEAIAKDIAMGRSFAPQGILPESVYTALEIKAVREGNVDLINELSQSKVPTRAGQGLKALDSVDPNSPVKILRDIRASREKTAEKRSGNDTKAEKKVMDKEIKKAASASKWDDFIKEVTCGY